MKNIGASVGAVPAQEKKQIEVEKQLEEEEEEECISMENEVVFFLKEAPEYRISGVAEWGEDSHGNPVKELDTYFLHHRTGQRCESAWSCLTGWSEPGEGQEKWETLCERIEEYGNLEETICDMKRVEL